MTVETYMYLGDNVEDPHSYWQTIWFIPHENLTEYVFEIQRYHSEDIFEKFIQFQEFLERLAEAAEAS